MKYFISKATGLVLAVDEKVKAGEGEHAVNIVDQYSARPDKYIPCKKDGTPLSAAKTTAKGTKKTPSSAEDKETSETEEPEGKE